ncbi:DinB family protein [Fibrella forsythiae]|uniref:DinB family protein n=1 Tax=Fibrella forsythiae TaxID=2817061 RepID=A0ABS3JIP9_9BACT|nr:DinB family protein [Fibrella forsythiae]MBO0949878.1 DinB family protein [Fibrella forsythiae]
MKIADLHTLMASEAADFSWFAAPLTESEFANRPNGRWSVGDTTQHLFLSARPVLRLMTGPREVFAQWGYAKGPSRTYEAIQEMYKQVLGEGIKAPANLSPRTDDVPADKATMLARLADTCLALAEQLTGWSEEELDRYQIPHPALGLISVREMLYFVKIHTRHHMAVLAAY